MLVAGPVPVLVASLLVPSAIAAAPTPVVAAVPVLLAVGLGCLLLRTSVEMALGVVAASTARHRRFNTAKAGSGHPGGHPGASD